MKKQCYKIVSLTSGAPTKQKHLAWKTSPVAGWKKRLAKPFQQNVWNCERFEVNPRMEQFFKSYHVFGTSYPSRNRSRFSMTPVSLETFSLLLYPMHFLVNCWIGIPLNSTRGQLKLSISGEYINTYDQGDFLLAILTSRHKKTCFFNHCVINTLHLTKTGSQFCKIPTLISIHPSNWL